MKDYINNFIFPVAVLIFAISSAVIYNFHTEKPHWFIVSQVYTAALYIMLHINATKK